MTTEPQSDLALVRSLRAENSDLKDELLGLHKGRGGGNSGGMEPRIAMLEAHMEHVRNDLGKLADVPATLADLKVRVEVLPSKEWLFRTLLAMLGAVSVIVGLIVRFLPHA